MPRKKAPELTIAVCDAETDPFARERVPQPFAWQFLGSDGEMQQFWGDDCTERFIEYLCQLKKPYRIFAHNGGKFDFHYLLDAIEEPIRIINGRLVQAQCAQHTLQDSYALMPFSLATYQKMKIDYANFERGKREKHKREILEYLHADCVYLLELCVAFTERFGARLTVGGTAIKELSDRHKFAKLSAQQDASFRPWYYGGRVQAFEAGELPGPWKVYDVNSMYSHVMRNYRHPVNGKFRSVSRLPDNFDKPYFCRFRGYSRGALPLRCDDMGSDLSLNFPHAFGEFVACSHEIEVALKHRLLDVSKVLECYVAEECISFHEFVDHFYAEKASAKSTGDKITELFSKFMLNSAYGKFGQNPENYEDYRLIRGPDGAELTDYAEAYLNDDGYSPYLVNPDAGFQIWSKPAENAGSAFYDVTIAASITSASRSVLLDAIQLADRPIYCDTDSLICRNFHGRIDNTELGAWKFEAEADHAAIAGKKLYALWNDGNRPLIKDTWFKVVSKGGTLTLDELREVAAGGEVEFISQVPTYSLNGERRFVKRTFRRTARHSSGNHAIQREFA